MAGWSCERWSAVHDFMPPREPRLRVTATCTAPTAGYAYELRRHEPQGINPADLLLDLVVTEPGAGGAVAAVVTETEVVYREETGVRYETVTVLPSGPSAIPVEVVA